MGAKEDNFMKGLGIEEFLRYALSGAVGLAIYWLAFIPGDRFSTMLKFPTLTFGVAMTFGAIIFALHRGFLYPLLIDGFILEHVQREIIENKEPDSALRLTQVIFDWHITWWEKTEDPTESPLRNSAAIPLRKWVAHYQSLYCSGWATLAALVGGRMLRADFCCVNGRWSFWFLVPLLFIYAAIYSDLRNTHIAMRVFPLHNRP